MGRRPAEVIGLWAISPYRYWGCRKGELTERGFTQESPLFFRTDSCPWRRSKVDFSLPGSVTEGECAGHADPGYHAQITEQTGQGERAEAYIHNRIPCALGSSNPAACREHPSHSISCWSR